MVHEPGRAWGMDMAAKLGKLAAVLIGLLIAAGAYIYFLAPETAYRWGIAAERHLAGLEVKHITVDGLDIAYLDGGQGQALVLLHGFGADKDNWPRMAAHLTDDYRVIAPDLPGFGDSERPGNGDYRVRTQAERVDDFVTALGVRRFHLGGNSMGGAIAGAYADAHADKLISLWLLSPAGVAGADTSEFESRLASGADNPLIPSTPEEFYTLLDWAFADPPYIPAPVKQVLGRKAAARHDLYQDIFKQLRGELGEGFVLEGIVANIDVPVLVIWGEDDRLLDVSGARVLADAAPDRVQVERMPGVGHVEMLERPKESAAAFRAFAAGLR